MSFLLTKHPKKWCKIAKLCQITIAYVVRSFCVAFYLHFSIKSEKALPKFKLGLGSETALTIIYT